MMRRIARVVIVVGVALLGCAGTTVGRGFQGEDFEDRSKTPAAPCPAHR